MPNTTLTEKEKIELVISMPAAVWVDMFGGLLSAGRMEEGGFSVCEENSDGSVLAETVFSEAGAAAEEFVNRRRLRRLGLDFETASEVPHAP